MENKHLNNAKVFKAFCDENRLMILELLRSGEKCACVLLEKLPIVQSTLSHHMKILTESGIVNARKDGKWTYYSFSANGVSHTKKLLNELTLFENDKNCEGNIDETNMEFLSEPNTRNAVAE